MEQNILILEAMLKLTEALNYSATYKQDLIDKLKSMYKTELNILHNDEK